LKVSTVVVGTEVVLPVAQIGFFTLAEGIAAKLLGGTT
jgi:hypothetical protein